MTAETTKATAEQLVAHCRAGTEAEGLDTLYDPEAVSVEATAMAGSGSREVRGVEAIKGKHAWWNSNMELHDQVVTGPYMHGDDRFAVIFRFDVSEKASGTRNQMQEVGVYTVGDGGKIVREEFFYTT
jgi:hypothetical protein